MKKEIVVLVGIALCTMLLVSPALASGALGVYGNANEDDTIDMRDLTHVKLIFFGKKPETELADAKYDGKINPLDFIQIKLIIVGKEKELTIVDSKDRVVTVKKPIKRVVVLWGYQAEAMRMLGVQDKIVGVSKYIKQDKFYFPEISKLPNVGYVDYEAILSLNPDLVATGAFDISKFVKNIPKSIPLVGLDFYKPKTFLEELVKFGYILDKKDKGLYYIDDFHDKYIDLVKVRTEKLSEEERPKVYVEMTFGPYETYAAGSGAGQMIDICGGRNIFSDIPGEKPITVDPETVVERNPDIIIKQTKTGDSGYGVDDTSKMKAIRDEVMNRPELASVNAVKKGRVYIIDKGLNYGLDYPIAIAYWAKWIQPDIFKDIDPKKIHQEFLTELQGLDYNLDKHGVFVYHPEEHPEGK